MSNNNGDLPAFPTAPSILLGSKYMPGQIGLSKREEIAKCVLAGLCANSTFFVPKGMDVYEAYSTEAIKQTDSLLKMLMLDPEQIT